MRIVHVCLAQFYVDNYGYQENIISKFHKIQGHEVEILASTETYINDSRIGYVEPGSYYNDDCIKVTRVPYSKLIPHKINIKLRIYNKIEHYLNSFEPDIIFIHDCQFLSINSVVKYCKKYKKTKVFVDSHTDVINSGRSWISLNILHKVIYRYCAQRILPYTQKFYGTLPSRSKFYETYYNIPNEKLDLLYMGADDTLYDLNNRASIRTEIRSKLGLTQDELVLITGGKIDQRKNIHEFISQLLHFSNPSIKLLVFGKIAIDVKPLLMDLLEEDAIIYLGWLNQVDIYKYYLAADLAVFPGTHSVLWEQAVGIGLPCIFKFWEGFQHLDLTGNCIFIDETSEAIEHILILKEQSEILDQMKLISRLKGVAKFSFSKIARRAIE